MSQGNTGTRTRPRRLPHDRSRHEPAGGGHPESERVHPGYLPPDHQPVWICAGLRSNFLQRRLEPATPQERQPDRSTHCSGQRKATPHRPPQRKASASGMAPAGARSAGAWNSISRSAMAPPGPSRAPATGSKSSAATFTPPASSPAPAAPPPASTPSGKSRRSRGHEAGTNTHPRTEAVQRPRSAIPWFAPLRSAPGGVAPHIPSIESALSSAYPPLAGHRWPSGRRWQTST